jgi:hypothetical protein
VRHSFNCKAEGFEIEMLRDEAATAIHFERLTQYEVTIQRKESVHEMVSQDPSYPMKKKDIRAAMATQFTKHSFDA